MGTYTKLLNHSQKADAKPPASPPVKAKKLVTQKATYASKGLSKPLRRDLNSLPAMEAVEELAFKLRKIQKVRINGDVPPAWKKRLDDLAHELGIGKYELVMYIVGRFLGEVEPPGSQRPVYGKNKGD